jgi:opacity protein-like surface antigen
MSESNAKYRLARAPLWAVRSLAKLLAKYAVSRSTLSALVALTLQSAPTIAQEQAGTQSVEIYGGELFGDTLTDAPVSGSTPRLNDDATAGARYNYNFTDMWAIQLAGGHSWSRASRVPTSTDKLGLTTVDLDAVWNITPQYPIVAYVLAGAGYAWANLDTDIAGTINGRPIVLTGSNGFTANAGVGAKYYVINNLFVDLQVRYRYLNRLVSDENQHLNTTETTLGIGWRF